jgi:diacylglycerol kinase (ATP)
MFNNCADLYHTAILLLMKKIIRSFGYAFKGLFYATKTQLNFRVHLGATISVLIFGFALHITTGEWEWVMLAVTMVLVAELINTTIEALTDLVSPSFNEKAGHVKDMAAAAVVITAIFALAVGLIIFVPHIMLLINHAA